MVAGALCVRNGRYDILRWLLQESASGKAESWRTQEKRQGSIQRRRRMVHERTGSALVYIGCWRQHVSLLLLEVDERRGALVRI